MELLPEVEVWYALPAIRRKLAVALKEQGLSQKEIAKKLGFAESAVSQYLSGKRGATDLPEKFDEEFSQAAKTIASGDANTRNQEMMRLSNLLKDSRAICDIHRQHADDVPDGCNCCFE